MKTLEDIKAYTDKLPKIEDLQTAQDIKKLLGNQSKKASSGDSLLVWQPIMPLKICIHLYEMDVQQVYSGYLVVPSMLIILLNPIMRNLRNEQLNFWMCYHRKMKQMRSFHNPCSEEVINYLPRLLVMHSGDYQL